MLRGVIVGCGFFSRIQMADWNRLRDQVEIVAACDADEARARQFARDFGIPRAYADAGVALDAERADFVDIVTRPEGHLPLVRVAAARKVHVLCQKPFAPTLAECEEMVRVADEAGIRLMVNENWRWQPWYREIKRRIEAGEIGEFRNAVWIHSNNDGLREPLYPNQPYFRDYPRLLIYETLVHYLDCSVYLFGRAERMRAATRRVNPVIRGEDEADIRLWYRNGARLWITGTRCGEVHENNSVMGRMRIDGTKNSLWLMGDGSLYRGTGALERLPFEPATEGYRGDSALATQRHFAECLREGREFESAGREYLFTVKMVERAYEAAAARSTVALD